MEIPFEKPPNERLEAKPAERIKLPTTLLFLEKNWKPVVDFNLFRLKTPEERKRYLKAIKDAREIGDNRRRFWNMLVSTVKRSGYRPPQGGELTIILNLGCGKCEEGIVLSAFFGGGNFGWSSENVKLIGVDINQEDIKCAISNYSIPDFSGKNIKYILPPNYEFIVGDATNLDQFKQIPKEVDVVVIRHQQISDNEAVWTEIFRQALQRISKDGIVIITSFSDDEHEMLIEALQKLDCEIVINEKNPYAKQLGHEEICLDRNIAIIRRKNSASGSTKPSNLPRAG